MELLIISTTLGALIGLILAVTGAGGASIAIPLLVLFLNITLLEAAPIALLTIFMASAIGALQGLILGTVRYKSALLIASVGTLIAPIGVKAATYTSNALLGATLCCVLLYLGIRTWLNAKRANINGAKKPEPACIINPETSRVVWTAPCTKMLTITGGVTGFLSGFLGVGGGFIIVPSLRRVSNFKHQTITATTLAAVSMIALSSLISHMYSNNEVHWNIALPLSISATIVMIFVSAIISHKIPEHTSRKIFAMICLIAAICLGMKNFI
ncbi:MAG TPA: sulfite exporter TauE/SafE family protein [Methylophilaceae bacterium]|nr:sulfite exporter TauE/SafE family protein [Methylophilaceae bacterium]